MHPRNPQDALPPLVRGIKEALLKCLPPLNRIVVFELDL